MSQTNEECCESRAARAGLGEKLTAAIRDLRVRLQAHYERRFPGPSRWIQDAIEEAESAAWCTPFPHLFFPDLAEVRIAARSRDWAVAG